MTNEDAIKEIREYSDNMVVYSEIIDEEPGAFCKALDIAIAALERDRWISVEEPPEENGRYLVRYLRDIDIEDGIHDDRIMIMRFLKNGGWRYPVICNEDVRQCVTMEAVTHWRKLPEPPKEDE